MSNDQAAQESEAQEFDRLFAEESKGTATKPADPQASGEATPAPAAVTAPTDQGGQAAPGDGGEGGGTPTEQPGDPATSTDWLAALPEDVQARIREEREQRDRERADFERRYNSLHGRLAPTQQALADTQRRLQQLSAPRDHHDSVAELPTSADFFESPKWKQYAETFPGDAEIVRAQFDAQRSMYQQALSKVEGRLQELDQRLGKTEQVTSRNVVNDEISILEARHKDWRELNESPQFWDWFFGEWVQKQPRTLRDQYLDQGRLGEYLSDGSWTANVLDDYKAQLQPPPAASSTPPAPNNAPAVESTQPAQTPPATATPPRVPARMQMGVAPEVRGSSPSTQAVPLDSLSEAEQFDAIWAQTTN